MGCEGRARRYCQAYFLILAKSMSIQRTTLVGHRWAWARRREGATTLSGYFLILAVNVNSKDNSGWTPLVWAAEGGHDDIVKLLLDTGQVDVNSKDYSGWTPLVWATKGGHDDIVKLFLDIGRADINAKDGSSKTLLAWAAEGGYDVIVKLLLDTGQVDVNAMDSFWSDAAMHARVLRSKLRRRGHVISVKTFEEG